MEFDFSNKCRACLKESNLMYPLFENYENNLTLADILHLFIRIEPNIYGLPEQICHDCTTVLVKFYNFTIIFEESIKKLQDYINIKSEYQEGFIKNTQVNNDDLHKKEELSVKNDFTDKSNNHDNQNILINIKEESKIFAEKNVEEIGTEIENCNNHEKIIIYTSNDSSYISEDEKLRCNLCDKNFKTLLLLKKHLKLHIQNKKFICEVCGYVTLKKSYLVDHMEMHTTVKTYSCNYCGKAFHRRSAFCRHKKIHTNPKQVVCEICGQKFTDPGNLKTHILLLHIKSRNFKCMLCNKSFSLKGTLDKHLRRHQHKEGATKNFACSECDMQYFDKSSLKRHYITKHSGVNVKFKCEFCNKEYTARANLYKHINNHHNLK